MRDHSFWIEMIAGCRSTKATVIAGNAYLHSTNQDQRRKLQSFFDRCASFVLCMHPAGLSGFAIDDAENFCHALLSGGLDLV